MIQKKTTYVWPLLNHPYDDYDTIEARGQLHRDIVI